MNPFEIGHAASPQIDEHLSSPSPNRQVPVNVASVRHRSPFRYPGGKTWLVPQMRRWLASLKAPVERFVEPFAGGAIVGLSALLDGLAKDITLIEKDSNVASVWQTIANGGAPELARLITSFDVTEDSVAKLFDAEIVPADFISKAFVTIVRNRVQRGGIMAPGASVMRNGENGRGIKSRWYPQTLENRLLDLHTVHSHILFQTGDGLEYLRTNASKQEFVWFIDPPYTVAGRRLYLHSQIDHQELFSVAASVAGPFLMTYDNTEEIRILANKFDFQVEEVVMKNSHHAVMKELLISRNLDWLKA